MIVLQLSQKALAVETWSFSGACKLVLGFLPCYTLISSHGRQNLVSIPKLASFSTTLRYFKASFMCSLFENLYLSVSIRGLKSEALLQKLKLYQTNPFRKFTTLYLSMRYKNKESS